MFFLYRVPLDLFNVSVILVTDMWMLLLLIRNLRFEFLLLFKDSISEDRF